MKETAGRIVDSKDVVVLAKVVVEALISAIAYAAPALVAAYRMHRRAEKVALLNLLLGWTVVGWLVLLAQALQPQRSRLTWRIGYWRQARP